MNGKKSKILRKMADAYNSSGGFISSTRVDCLVYIDNDTARRKKLGKSCNIAKSLKKYWIKQGKD